MTAFTEKQLADLEVAISQGVLKVKYTDKEVTYRSIDEMMRLRYVMRRALGLISSASTRIYYEHDKDLS